jgi:hypothetical protein
MGSWKFFKGGAGTYRVEFESIVCSQDQEGEGRRRESIGWGSVSPGRGGVRRTRRASEVSEYESGEPATPEGVEVGLGLGLAFVAVPEEGRGRILGYGERREEEEEMDRAFPKLGKSPVICEYSLEWDGASTDERNSIVSFVACDCFAQVDGKLTWVIEEESDHVVSVAVLQIVQSPQHRTRRVGVRSEFKRRG